MHIHLRTLLACSIAMGAPYANADVIAHFDMSVHSGTVKESISGNEFPVKGNFEPENVPGAIGEALRFDGYTSRIDASIGDILPAGSTKMTVSIWVAVPCYPIIQIDTNTSEKTPIATCLDTTKKTGFGFYLGFNGKYSFRTYIGGWPVNIDVDIPLPTYTWNNLVAVIDTDNRSIKLYNNGIEVGSSRITGSFSLPASKFHMGQGTESRMSGPFQLMSFNGLIDDITIWNEAKDIATIGSWKPENTANLNIPSSRFADDILRPRFHGMPAAGWTNECHGMYYSDGRYHLFFQKNGDGPYMARLHWGHISSENLYDWKEEKIALAPGDWYDIKGCWSGCVFADEKITGGEPNILYTAVDYAKAMIAQANPESPKLENWKKSSKNPIIDGRPSGLSDDFRDPYFFRHGDNAYIIVGTSKDGLGATTLHRYNQATGKWSNNGDIFFSGSSKSVDGTFWEMPNITPMGNSKWLFTATPLGTSQGVRTLYWVGTIGNNGNFIPDAKSQSPRLVELESREGFGLLSPTVYNHNGKTIVLGIVPDKLSGNDNWKLGWAHCYSLPREWTLSDDGTLIQKPYEGLRGLRTTSRFQRNDFTLKGAISLAPISGRQIEICTEIEVGTSPFGFSIFKGNGNEGTITFEPASGNIVMDFSNLPRLVNDAGIYNGIYRCKLPERPAVGSLLKLNIFVDHSIIDIFINDRWATSVRVFPTDASATTVEAFAEEATIRSLLAWNLNGDIHSGIEELSTDLYDNNTKVNVYSLSGVLIKADTLINEALDGLTSGIYIVGNKKVRVP